MWLFVLISLILFSTCVISYVVVTVKRINKEQDAIKAIFHAAEQKTADTYKHTEASDIEKSFAQKRFEYEKKHAEDINYIEL